MNDYSLLAPEIFLVCATAVVRLIDLFFLENRRVLNLHLSVLALLGSYYPVANGWRRREFV